MNQAYFTFCCSGAGKSLSGLGGDRVRAAVKGSSESELTLYKQYCNYPQYSQSSKTDSSSETTFDSEQFAKLVLGKTETGANAQRFLAHSVYALPDKETLREGNYFSHLIYPVPNSWTVRTALQMWRSPFWVTQDSDDISPELPPIDDNNIPFGTINENSFVEFLHSSSERQKKFLFLLQCFLTLKPGDKIVLTGLPEDAAFDPNANIPRQMFALYLFRLAGGEAKDPDETLAAYADADRISAFCRNALSWASEQGIMGGYNGKILPHAGLTRAEAATMLLRYTEQ